MSSENRIAIFVDTENLTGWVKQHGIVRLIEEIGQTGHLFVRKAYGCWEQGNLQVQQQVLNRCGFELVHTFHPVGGKNSADIRITIDVMETVLCHDFETIVLATGDSDFSPLFRRLNQLGKHIIGAGPHSPLSDSVASICQKYIYTDVPPYATPKPARPAKPIKPLQQPTNGKTSNSEMVRALKLVTRGIEAMGGKPSCSALKNWMSKGQSGFNEKKLGYKRFNDFLRDIDGLSVTESENGTWFASWKKGYAPAISAAPAAVTTPAPAPHPPEKPEATTEDYQRILRKKSWCFVSPQVIETCAECMRTLPPYQRSLIADTIWEQTEAKLERTEAQKAVELFTKANLLQSHDNTADVAAVNIEFSCTLKPYSNEEILRQIDRCMLMRLLTALEATSYEFDFECFEPLLHSVWNRENFDSLYEDVATELLDVCVAPTEDASAGNPAA
ncbi:NYN domain-containing protein [bacterium]|nr:NYN domain-containing protein [bacterium]